MRKSRLRKPVVAKPSTDVARKGQMGKSTSGCDPLYRGKQLWDVYFLPFKVAKDDPCGYIYDDNNNTVADHMDKNCTFQTRGWGRLKYLPDAEDRFSAIDARLTLLVGKPSLEDAQKTVEILNAQWRKGEEPQDI